MLKANDDIDNDFTMYEISITSMMLRLSFHKFLTLKCFVEYIENIE